MDTAAEPLDAVRDAVAAHMALNPKEFLADSLTCYLQSMGDPLKMNLALYWTYTHNGAPRAPFWVLVWF